MGRDSWRCLVASLERAPIDGDDIASIAPSSSQGEIPTWRLTVGDRERPLAAAEIGLGADGCGVVWWMDVEPAERGRGVGGRLLRQSLRFLVQRGAVTATAFVDHDDPRERDPRPVLRLLTSTGFEEVDRLWSYESPRRRAR
jgi:GNAT superfamily N-acetyltransferase